MTDLGARNVIHIRQVTVTETAASWSSSWEDLITQVQISSVLNLSHMTSETCTVVMFFTVTLSKIFHTETVSMFMSCLQTNLYYVVLVFAPT